MSTPAFHRVSLALALHAGHDGDGEGGVKLSPEAVQRSGIRTAPAEHALLGDEVQRGDVLAVIDSTELGEARAWYLRANAQLALADQNLVGGRCIAHRGEQYLVRGEGLVENLQTTEDEPA